MPIQVQCFTNGTDTYGHLLVDLTASSVGAKYFLSDTTFYDIPNPSPNPGSSATEVASASNFDAGQLGTTVGGTESILSGDDFDSSTATANQTIDWGAITLYDSGNDETINYHLAAIAGSCILTGTLVSSQ